MSRILGHLLRAVCMFGMLVCLGFSLAGYTRLDSMRNVTNYSLAGQQMGLDDVTAIRTKEEKLKDGRTGFTAWTEKKNESVSNKELNRDATATVILLNGDSVNLYFSEVNLTESDTGSCLISRDASFDLFGDAEAIGETFQYGDREVKIAGLLESGEKLIVMQAVKEKKAVSVNGAESDADRDVDSGAESDADSQETDGIAFDQIAVYSAEDNREMQKKEIADFAERNGLNGESSDMSMYQNTAGLFSALIPMVMAFTMIVLGIRTSFKDRRKPVMFCLDLAVTVLFCFALYWISGTRFTLTADMVPPQWSDFDFWGKQIGDGVSGLKQMLFSSKGLPEIEYYNAMLASVLFSIGGMACFVISIAGVKFETAGYFYLYLVMSLLACLAAIMVLKQHDVVLFRTALIYMSYPLYLFGKYILCDIKREGEGENEESL